MDFGQAGHSTDAWRRYEMYYGGRIYEIDDIFL